ncbi:hypothetical protein [Pelotalea chapellei]|uniref:Uncharacterized protein n=1 Tax=Pelotalea chapellei TaxID=44671 RepID=A0ABS5UAV0_9BACT|nr:hypothetical protein [Pelotalea chapellei]MBT1072780.1 hypothetical protein [Pelotalea chapellei]
MKYRWVVVAMVLVCMGLGQSAFADELSLKAGDTIQKILENSKGKQVTLRLAHGEEMTGKVRSVTKELVLLSELSDRNYYDGIIDVGQISAVVMRVKK